MTMITVTHGPMNYIKHILPEDMTEEKAEIAAKEVAETAKWNVKMKGKERFIRVWKLVSELRVDE